MSAPAGSGPNACAAKEKAVAISANAVAVRGRKGRSVAVGRLDLAKIIVEFIAELQHLGIPSAQEFEQEEISKPQRQPASSDIASLSASAQRLTGVYSPMQFLTCAMMKLTAIRLACQARYRVCYRKREALSRGGSADDGIPEGRSGARDGRRHRIPPAPKTIVQTAGVSGSTVCEPDTQRGVSRDQFQIDIDCMIIDQPRSAPTEDWTT